MPKKGDKKKNIKNDSDEENVKEQNENAIDIRLLNTKFLNHQQLINEINVNKFLKQNGIITLSY